MKVLYGLFMCISLLLGGTSAAVDVEVDETLNIAGTQGTEGIIFPDSTKQTTAATSSLYQQRVSGTCPLGQAISQIYSGGGVYCQTVGTGTVTSVGTGGGLTGGPISTTGTISIAAGGITDSMLASGISASKISGNISGSAASITGSIPEAQVTNLSTDLGNRATKGANSDITSLSGLTATRRN